MKKNNNKQIELLKYWNEFIENINNIKLLYLRQSMLDNPPELINDDAIIVFADDKQQREEIANHAKEILTFLKHKMGNYNLDMCVGFKLNPTDEEERNTKRYFDLMREYHDLNNKIVEIKLEMNELYDKIPHITTRAI